MVSTSTLDQKVLIIASITTHILARNQLYVPEPPLQEEKALIWKSQVLIPFNISDITHVFSSSLPDLNMNVERVSEILPCYHHTKPLAVVDKPLDFTYMSTCVFQLALYTNQLNYLHQLNKVESKKGKIWKDQGLFNLIQLSRVGHVCRQNMLLVALHFWESSTNTFQMRYDMITPTN